MKKLLLALLLIASSAFGQIGGGISSVPYVPAAVAITGGTIKLDDGTAAAPSYSFAGAITRGMYNDSNGGPAIAASGIGVAIFQVGGNSGLFVNSGYQLGWGSTGLSTPDLKLSRDAANTLAQRNGTAAQAFNLYNTYTDASNYERLSFSWVTNVATFNAQGAGTGAGRDISFAGAAGSWTIDLSNQGALFPNVPKKIGRAANPLSQIYIDYTNTGTVGAVTINKAAGRVNMAASGTSFTVTNSLVTANSHIFLNADSAPGNVVAVQFFAVAAAGSFTVNAVPAITNQTAIDFFVVNAD